MTAMATATRSATHPPPDAPGTVDDARPLALTRLDTGRAPEHDGHRWGIPRWVERLAGVLLVLALWQLASSLGWITTRTLAGPADTFHALVKIVDAGTLQSAVWVSLKRVAVGLGIGVPIGAFLAIAAGLSRPGEDLIDAPMQMLRFLPIIGLESLFVLWLGVGDTAKVSLIVMGVTFPVYINTFSAVRSIDPELLELARVVGLRRSGLLRKVVLPGALPGFLVGLRLAGAMAWLLLVFAEQLNASNGIGYLMIKAQTFFQTDVIVVCLVVYAVLGLLSDALVRFIERRALRWQPGR
jgi:sulfonate transport system permease protein